MCTFMEILRSPKDQGGGKGNPPNPPKQISDEAAAIDRLRLELKTGLEWFKSRSEYATKSDLKESVNKIMSVISDFAAKQAAFNKRQGDAVDAAVASVTGLSTDIQALADKITELQNSPGAITPEDQALLNEAETQGDALAAKVEALSNSLSALDALNPPAPPVG